MHCYLGFNMAAPKTTASFVEPMLLLRTESLPDGPNWLLELKLDGYRGLAVRKSGGKVQLRSRNNNDFTARYPAIAKALASIPDETVVDAGRWRRALMPGRLFCFLGTSLVGQLFPLAPPRAAIYHRVHRLNVSKGHLSVGLGTTESRGSYVPEAGGRSVVEDHSPSFAAGFSRNSDPSRDVAADHQPQ